MWRTGSIVSLKKLSQFVQRSNRNVVWRLYHAQSGCFGYRPLPQVLVEGKLPRVTVLFLKFVTIAGK